MQVDRHGANLRQQDIETLDGVVFELRKHKGFELTVFLEAPKPFSTLSKTELGVMQSPNRGLPHLRMNYAQMQEFLLCLGQVVLLTMVGPKRLRSFNDVFLLEGASIHPAQARSNPVFELA